MIANHKVALITGKSGCGKSALVTAMAEVDPLQIQVIDPLRQQPGTFVAPGPTVTIVVIDHVTWLTDATDYGASLLAWAESTNATVILVDQNAPEILALNLPLPSPLVILELQGNQGSDGVIVHYGDEHQHYPPNAFVQMLSSLTAA